MTAQIRTTPLAVTLLGASMSHDATKSYGSEIRSLLDRVWPVLKTGPIPNKGINWVVYNGCDRVFAGVEAEVADPAALGLERLTLGLGRHAWIKHIGPYQLLGTAYTALNKAIADHGLRAEQPRIEVYGHWNNDESKLETELIVPVS
ncbi:MAG: GyrI-like domain-containing protein [Phycisphaerales bacterium]